MLLRQRSDVVEFQLQFGKRYFTTYRVSLRNMDLLVKEKECTNNTDFAILQPFSKLCSEMVGTVFKNCSKLVESQG
jgi:hypothetical protein